VAIALRTSLRHGSLLSLLLLSPACGRQSAPGDGLLLPPELVEVSGVVAVDARTVACVQDEVGAIFYVDLLGERPVRAVPFGPPGDYEGLAMVGQEFWVLRSDGLLLQVVPVAGGLAIAASHPLSLPYTEYEGLCWQPEAGHLLVLPKSRAGDRKAERNQLHAYAWVPATSQLLPQPVLTLSRSDASAAVAALLPERPAGDRQTLKLHCSEILDWPQRDGFLLLSAVDQLLLRVDRDGRVAGCRTLDPSRLPQPEGMTWLPDGRLLLASEGRGGAARLLVVDPP
jgi:uncharacterized protein YjiK